MVNATGRIKQMQILQANGVITDYLDSAVSNMVIISTQADNYHIVFI